MAPTVRRECRTLQAPQSAHGRSLLLPPESNALYVDDQIDNDYADDDEHDEESAEEAPDDRACRAPGQPRPTGHARGQTWPILADSVKAFKKHCLQKPPLGTGIINEINIFAYCIFNDHVYARRWALSPPCLQALDAYFSAGSPNQFPKATSINMIFMAKWKEEGRDLEWAKAEWPVVLNERTNGHDDDSKENANKMLPFLMYWLPMQSDRHLNLLVEAQKAEYDNLKLDNKLWLPPWEVLSQHQLVSPTWKHPSDKTNPAEQCSRTFGLLRYLWHKINNLQAGKIRSVLEGDWKAFWNSPKPFEPSPLLKPTNRPG